MGNIHSVGTQLFLKHKLFIDIAFLQRVLKDVLSRQLGEYSQMEWMAVCAQEAIRSLMHQSRLQPRKRTMILLLSIICV